MPPLAEPRRLPAAATTLGGAALLAAVVAASAALATDRGDALTRNTIRLSLAWYAAALILMQTLKPDDWDASTRVGRLARSCWTWAWACFLVHLGMAFHYVHHWSHADAFRRTRAVSGLGEGVYVSYLFTLLWTVDVAFWWIRPYGYAARSQWIDRTLHAFMLFIVFNSMVVFETGLIRWAGLAMFAVFAVAWFAANRRRTAPFV